MKNWVENIEITADNGARTIETSIVGDRTILDSAVYKKYRADGTVLKLVGASNLNANNVTINEQNYYKVH